MLTNLKSCDEIKLNVFDFLCQNEMGFKAVGFDSTSY